MNEENDSSQLIKRIEELEAIVTGKDIVESAGWWGRFSAYQFNQRKAVEAERDQLTADYESILVDHNKLLAEHVAMGAENMKLAANLKVTRGWSAKLVDFLSEGLEAAWDGCDWDGSDIQDKAEELGLIKSEPYDPKKHGEITCLPVERDTVTFYTICEEVLQLKELGTPDTDHCPSCGEYLHDEMGHMCPRKGTK